MELYKRVFLLLGILTAVTIAHTLIDIISPRYATSSLITLVTLSIYNKVKEE